LSQVEDTDTGLTYLNARYYDPVLSRFLSPDPLMNPTDPRTLDPYRYANNNPILFQDASGLSAACAAISATAARNACFADFGAAELAKSATANSVATQFRIRQLRGEREHWKGRYQQQLNFIHEAAANAEIANDRRTSVVGDLVYASAMAVNTVYIQDFKDCLGGSVMGCVWAATNFIPGGSAAHGAGALTHIDDAARAANDLAHVGDAAHATMNAAETTARLQSHVDEAVAQFERGDIGLSRAQSDTLVSNPNLEAAFRGQVIDNAAKGAARQDEALSHLWTSRPGEFGPDFHDVVTNTWWDITTTRQWNAHVDRYANPFGAGILLPTG
jgi:RHS repeat-associated protein